MIQTAAALEITRAFSAERATVEDDKVHEKREKAFRESFGLHSKEDQALKPLSLSR